MEHLSCPGGPSHQHSGAQGHWTNDQVEKDFCFPWKEGMDEGREVGGGGVGGTVSLAGLWLGG